MSRGIPNVTALLAIACLGGCSSGSPSDPATATTQADLSVQCGGGGHRAGQPVTISLAYFDPTSFELSGWDDRGRLVVSQLTTSTTLVSAPLATFPPDPIECLSAARDYDDAIARGLTSAVTGDIAVLANNGCDVSLALASDGSVASFQPVP